MERHDWIQELPGLFRFVAVCGFALMACPLAAQAVPAGTVDLYVFAGQSNMRGHVSELSREFYGPSLVPAPYQLAFQSPVTWAQEWNNGHQRPAADDATSGAFGATFVPYFAAHDSATQQVWPWGPEVAFLYNRHAASSAQLYFIKYAIGGTSLFEKPGIANWNAKTTGTDSLLSALAGRVNAATGWLLNHGGSAVAVHLLWAQGESDMGSDGQSYLVNFLNFNSAMHALLKAPKVSFNVASMTLVADAASHNAEANINIAATRVGSQIVNEHDFARTSFITDNIHLDPAGQVLHGTDMEVVTRTRPRVTVDHTRTMITTLNLPMPKAAGPVAYIPTIADGSTGLEITGATNGLAIDPLTGKLSVTDLGSIQPGLRTMKLYRHTAPSIEISTLQINFLDRTINPGYLHTHPRS